MVIMIITMINDRDQHHPDNRIMAIIFAVKLDSWKQQKIPSHPKIAFHAMVTAIVRYHDAISFPLTLFHKQEHLVFLTRLLNLIFKGPHLGLNVIN